MRKRGRRQESPSARTVWSRTARSNGRHTPGTRSARPRRRERRQEKSAHAPLRTKVWVRNVRRSSPSHSRPLVPALLIDRDEFSKCVHRRDYSRGSETTDCAGSQLALRGSARLPVSLARLTLFKFVTSESPRLGTSCPVRLSAEVPGASRGTAARWPPSSCCRPLSCSLCLRGCSACRYATLEASKL